MKLSQRISILQSFYVQHGDLDVKEMTIGGVLAEPQVPSIASKLKDDEHKMHVGGIHDEELRGKPFVLV